MQFQALGSALANGIWSFVKILGKSYLSPCPKSGQVKFLSKKHLYP